MSVERHVLVLYVLLRISGYYFGIGTRLQVMCKGAELEAGAFRITRFEETASLAFVLLE